MKKKVLLFTLTAGIGAFALSSYHAGPALNGYDCTGGESAGTGSLANPTGCSLGSGGCHGTTATSTITAALELDSAGVATTHYMPGNTYTVKITGTNGSGSTLPRYGFQIAALKGAVSTATESDGGTWATTGLPATTHIAPPISTPTPYSQLTVAEQSAAIVCSGTSFTESFSWTAPAAGTGSVSFWGVVNFVNGNGNADGGDLWNTNHVVINEWTTLSVSSVANNISLKAFPNPVINNLSLQMDNTEAGTYSVQVSDMTGRTILNESIAVNGTSHTSNINTSNWLPGTYNVVIEKGGNRQVIPVVKL